MAFVLQIVGLIVAVYTITRFISMITWTPEKGESTLTQWFAAVALLATCFLTYTLLNSGSHTPSP